MKLYGNKLAGHLAGRLGQLYLVSGDEPLLLQEACDEIRATAKKAGFLERELFHVDGSFDWNELLYSTNSMSLFADKKLLEVRMPTAKPGDQGGKVLSTLAQSLSEDIILLVVAPRLDQPAQKTAWFKAVEKSGVFVQIWPIDAKELPGWLDARFRREGLKASREAITAMAERIEGNLLAAVQEIARLKLVTTDGRIDLHHVTEGVADSARFDVFKLIDSALLGDSARAVRMVQGLKNEGVDALFVVNMLAREIRSLEGMARACGQGQNMRDVLKKASVWVYRKNIVTRCLDRHTDHSLAQLQLDLGEVDRIVKGASQGDPWREMTSVCLGLAGVVLPRDAAHLTSTG